MSPPIVSATPAPALLCRGLIIGFLFFVTGASFETPTVAHSCFGVEAARVTRADAAPLLAECLARLPAGATVQLSRGTYRLLTPLVIVKPVTIETVRDLHDCTRAGAARCAKLVIGEVSSTTGPSMPIEVVARDVRLRSLVIEGAADRSSAWLRRTCLNDAVRPMGGGIRVRRPGFELVGVRLRNFSCYTALEVLAGVDGVVVKNSEVGPNGRHDSDKMWADGITVHDATHVRIENNSFVGNTDVQLILGGCRGCVIAKNRFRHSSAFGQASFAELMLHAWPNTSGDFSGTVVSDNDIDCGVARRCGYGIMIGGEPWYPSRAHGGAVINNRVSNARLGLNVDRLTGPMTVRGNAITQSGGPALSDCRRKNWPAINISPDSVRWLDTDIKDRQSFSTRGCLLNRRD